MIKRIEEKLDDSELLCEILKGVSISVSIAMVFVVIICGVYMFDSSAWWAIGFVLATIACGFGFGFTSYLFNEY